MIPVVVVAWNRPESLSRLLHSLEGAFYTNPVDLIISIDGGGGMEVVQIANSFQWKFGEKRVLLSNINLGLRNHILKCGDLTVDYDGIILLEDDLFVAPGFYQFALQALDYYKDEYVLGGISLYAHPYNETAHLPFVPLSDDSDIYFFQCASSWGQVYSRKQWSDFRTWYKQNLDYKFSEDPKIPANVVHWPETSWKKFYIAYLINQGKFFLYPRVSFSTNFGDRGVHMVLREQFLQVPLQYTKQTFLFKPFGNSTSVYDASCEILPERLKILAPFLGDYDFCVDLFGLKQVSENSSPWWLTSQKTKSWIFSFGRELKPMEANVIHSIPGDYFTFCRREDIIEKPRHEYLSRFFRQNEMLYHYHLRHFHFFVNSENFSGKFENLNMDDLPSISVITPVYNGAAYLADAIESVLRQNYHKFEHIIVDGGSTDGTLEILRKYTHIKWISEPDHGQSDAMNKGFRMSTGDIILYLNADDYINPNAFKTVVPYFLDGANFVVGKILVLDSFGKAWVNDAKIGHSDMLRHWEPQAFCVNPVGYYYRRGVQAAVGGYNESNHSSMDVEFLLDASRKFDFVKVKEDFILGVYRNFEGTKTVNNMNSPVFFNYKRRVYIDRFLNQMPLEYVVKYTKDREEYYSIKKWEYYSRKLGFNPYWPLKTRELLKRFFR